MKLLVLTLLVAFGEAYFNIKIEQHSPAWPTINGTSLESDIPESPTSNDGAEGVTENPDTNGALFDEVASPVSSAAGDKPLPPSAAGNSVGVEGRAEDLSNGYSPGYCRCINKYYCFGANYQRERVQRAVNTVSSHFQKPMPKFAIFFICTYTVIM